ncbi:MAG TPA: MauE/DoxX family redox-associated membrane protein [Candidatus Dormibacteraeota bacterium]|nr:MauE/DoxX family redox-associated membrane protein [Candidatus Dormibacteraeota bacterium]
MSRQAIFRTLTVLTAIVTVLLSWPVWQVHAEPPSLPLLPLPAVSLGIALIAALLLCLGAPLAGWCAYVGVFAYAVLTDQTRLQPEFLTFAFFLAAGLPGAAGLTLARVYLVTLWFYAGLHKLLSVDFMTQSDTWMLRTMTGDPAPWLRALFPWTIVAAEIGTALLALVPRTRRLAVAAAILLHGGILLSLVRADWNRTVWPWNLLCAIAAVFLILPWRRSLGEEWRAARPAVRLGALVLAVYPLGFYAGVVDTYLSHSLYAQDQPRGYVCNLSGDPQPRRPGLGTEIAYNHRDGPFQCREIFVSDVLGVPLPPLHRLFADYFTRTCISDEFLLILERRRFTAEDARQVILRCPVDVEAPAGETPRTRL